MKKLFEFSLIVLLFCGPAVLFLFGWSIDWYASPSYQKLRPEFYILIFLVIYYYKTIFDNHKIFNSEISVLFLSLLLVVYLGAFVDLENMAIIPNTILIPTLISILLYILPISIKKSIRYILLTFLILTSIVAFIERLNGRNFLPYYSGGQLGDVDIFKVYEGFRSSAFQNHPLSNAVLIATILPFIWYTPYIKKLTYKITLVVLGFGSLFCFNARASIIICGAFFALYIFYCVFLRRTYQKLSVSRSSNIYLLFAMVSISFLLFSLNFGDRLLADDNLNDTSVGARLTLFDLFMSMDISSFFSGMSSSEMSLITSRAGLSHIENFWFMYLCRFGFVFFLLYIWLFVVMIKKRFTGVKFIDSLFLFLPALVVASTNNSIYGGNPVIAVLILCQYSFLSNNEEVHSMKLKFRNI